MLKRKHRTMRIIDTCKWFINGSFNTIQPANISYDLIEKFLGYKPVYYTGGKLK